MLGTRIKVCGITSPADAKLCMTHGADYLGLIFAESPRRVTVEAARPIRDAVLNAILVGVFADMPVDEVARIARACGLDMIQLHGNESPLYCNALHGQLSLPVIKAVSASQIGSGNDLKQYKRTSYFLFDLDKGAAAQRHNGPRDVREDLWRRAAAMRRRGYRIFLAGGLDVTNVREAVANVEPYGIDVARGVEKSPGVKDPQTLRRFIKAVKP